MAAVARQSRVLALQYVAGLAVVKGSQRGVPANERKVFPVVLGVATGALLLTGTDGTKGGVQSAFGGYTGGNVGMALHALEAGRPGRQLVATGALGGTTQRLVRPRKRARRDLRPARGREQQEQGEEQK